MSSGYLSFEATSELLMMLYAESFLVNLLNIFLLIFTGRNEVVAKVIIFLHLSVIHSVHRGEGVYEADPLGADTPLPRVRHPPGSRHPLRSRHPPEQTPPAYGQRAAGTHPTGMHSCIVMIRQNLFNFCCCKLSFFKLNITLLPKNVRMHI